MFWVLPFRVLRQAEDIKMLFWHSDREKILEDETIINGKKFYIYFDAAYFIRPYMQVPFVFWTANEIQRAFRTTMSKVRIAVEWNYKDMTQMWTGNDYAGRLNIRESPIALLYIGAALLLNFRNFRTCLYFDGKAGSYVKCRLLSLREFVESLWLIFLHDFFH